MTGKRRIGKRRIAVGVVALGLLVCAIVITQVGCGSTSDRDASSNTGIYEQLQDGVIQPLFTRRQNVVSHDHRRHGGTRSVNIGGHRRVRIGVPSSVVAGGKMLGAGSGWVSGDIISPDTSGWTVTSHIRTTFVEAGGDTHEPSDGVFGIMRTSHVTGRQTSSFVRVAGSGPVTITKAPLGRKMVVSAQKHGNIEFKGKSGVTGTLHLNDDTVTLNP